MSKLVLVEKYQLKVPIPGSKGQKYDKNGQKELIHGKRLVDRIFVEHRNSQDNNELYILFEEETKELMDKREQNIKNNAVLKAKENVGMADLVDALRGNPAPKEEETAPPKKETALPPPSPEPDQGAGVQTNSYEGKTVDELKKLCDEKGIEYHHKAGTSKLI